MFRVFSCLTGEHDWRLVVLAGVVCILASLVTINLFHRARATGGRVRSAWLALAGATAGCGMWATHFIAMLAYKPGVDIAFGMGMTALSLLATALVTFAGLNLAVNGGKSWTVPVGGAIVGGGIAVMHYTGMSAMELPGHVTWHSDLVLASLALGIAFGAAALTLAVRRDDNRGTVAAAMLLTLAIVSHHFTAMGAVEIVADPTRAIASASLDATALAIAVAAVALLILGMVLVGAIAASHVAARSQQFANARQQLVRDSEEKLHEQHLLLDTALNSMSQGLVLFDKDFRLVMCNQRYLEMYQIPQQVADARPTFREVLAGHYARGIFRGGPGAYVDGIIRDVRADELVTRTVETADGRVITVRNRLLANGSRIATHEDITERHNFEQTHADIESRLREQKVQLDTALNNMSQGLCMFDASERVVLANRRFIEMYRLSPDVVKRGCTFLELVTHRRDVGLLDANPEEYCRKIRDSIASGESSSLLVHATDGRIVRALNHPMPDGGWVTTHEDITEQRHAEEQLRNQTLQLDMSLDNMSQGLVMFDHNARLILCNRRYLDIYNLPPDLVKPGVELSKLLEIRKAQGTFSLDPQTYLAELKSVMDGGKTFNLIAEMSDGRIISIDNQPMAGGGWVSTHDDITEQREVEKQLREQKIQLDTALNNMIQGLNMFDAAGQLVVCNDRYREIYRLAPDSAQPGCSIHDLVQARIEAGTFFAVGAEQYIDELMAAMTKREPTSTTMELTDGRTIAVISRPTPDGTGWVVTHEDISERRRVEEERDRSQAFANTVIENVPATIIVKNARDLRYVMINRAGETYYDITREQMIGKTAHDIFPKEMADKIAVRDERLLATNEALFVEEHSSRTPSGGTCIIQTMRVPIRDQHGKPEYLLTVVEDRTNRKRAEAQIAHMANHDLLTGLPNRAAYNVNLASTIETAAKAGSTFALMSLDITRLKTINDVFGHAVGDRLLVEMSKRLQTTAGSAFVARLGGNEFGIIATEGEQPATAEALAERLLATAAPDFDIDGRHVQSGLTIGIATFPANGQEPETLAANVDAALYRAKDEDHGHYRFFEPDMDKQLRERRALQEELRSAIERKELTLHYQPQAKISGEVTGFEALLRWRHPVRGLVSPGTFVPLAEESGLIIPMGEWILRDACRQAASWPKPLHIAVNLSPVQFRHGDLAALVHSILLETGLPPARLELEITEGVLIGDFSRAVSILRRLKALGVRIAMDDFGTGYSSLSYLQAFPFDKIKIDQAFISNLESNPQSATIIRAVIGLARGLGLPVIAEGVETEAQHQFLAQENCDEVQGYLIGRPLPIEEYAEVVGHHKKRAKLTIVSK